MDGVRVCVVLFKLNIRKYTHTQKKTTCKVNLRNGADRKSVAARLSFDMALLISREEMFSVNYLWFYAIDF